MTMLIKNLKPTIIGIIALLFLGCNLTTSEVSFIEDYAYKKFPLFRAENEKAIKNDQTDGIVFLGDSITDHGNLDKYYSDIEEDYDLSIFNRGIGADTVDKLYDRAFVYDVYHDTQEEGFKMRLDIQLFDLKPKYIVFLMGINDLYQGQTDDILMANYDGLFSVIKEKLPETKMLIQSVYPIWEDPTKVPEGELATGMNLRVKGINEKLKNLVEAEFPEYTYLDIADQMIIEGTYILDPKFVDEKVDGLHPDDEGKALINEIVEPILRSIINGNN